jgi:hypothetical protein
MINDSTVKTSNTGSIGDRRFVLSERTGMIADHLLDTNAKAYAISIRLNGLSDAESKSNTNQSVAKAMTKVD